MNGGLTLFMSLTMVRIQIDSNLIEYLFFSLSVLLLFIV